MRLMLGTSKQGVKEAKSDTVRQQIEAPANSKTQETVDHLLFKYNKENDLQFIRRLTTQNLLDTLYESISEREKNKLLQLTIDDPVLIRMS